jgi:hypothetical protein
MQLNDPQRQGSGYEENYQQMINQQNYHYDGQDLTKQDQKYSKNDYVDSEEEEDDQQLPPVQDQYSDNEEPQNIPSMQSKFRDVGVKVESAQMFDDDTMQNKNQQMEPIQEGYSSDDSFRAQQKYKNFQENLEYINEENKKKDGKPSRGEIETKPKQKRNHINLRTDIKNNDSDNKENRNVKNINSKSKDPRKTKTIPEQKLKRPGTAKMRSSNGFRSTYSRPQTATTRKTTKRPSTAMSTSSGFMKKTGLKAKMLKKSDPVSRYKAMQNSWAKNKFLSKHKGTKQGRKLDLAGFNQWANMVQNSQVKPVVKQIHKYINPNQPLASNKRDDMRFHLRAKMSNEDYVDKSMKFYHYKQVV